MRRIPDHFWCSNSAPKAAMPLRPSIDRLTRSPATEIKLESRDVSYCCDETVVDAVIKGPDLESSEYSRAPVAPTGGHPAGGWVVPAMRLGGFEPPTRGLEVRRSVH